MPPIIRNPDAQEPILLQKGRYVFTENLEVIENEGSSVPIIAAKGFTITEKDGLVYGDFALVNISDLILKTAAYRDDNGRLIEAHKLYTWPRNLGSTEEWTQAKTEYLSQQVLNFPIEVTATAEEGGLSWTFITPERFKSLPKDMEMSTGFKHFADQPQDYFFLRRPVNEPR